MLGSSGFKRLPAHSGFELPKVRDCRNVALINCCEPLYSALGQPMRLPTAPQLAGEVSRVSAFALAMRRDAWREFMGKVKDILEMIPADAPDCITEIIVQKLARNLTICMKLIAARAYRLLAQALARMLLLRLAVTLLIRTLLPQGLQRPYWLDNVSVPVPLSCSPRNISRRGPPLALSAPA